MALHPQSRAAVAQAASSPPRPRGTGSSTPPRRRLAEPLAEGGVSVVATRYLGLVHGFSRHPQLFDAAEPLTRQVAGFLSQHRP